MIHGIATMEATPGTQDSLMAHDPVNDRKTVSVLDERKIPIERGSSGVQIKLKMDMMLDGHRPADGAGRPRR